MPVELYGPVGSGGGGIPGLISINADVTAAQTLAAIDLGAGNFPILIVDGGGGAHTIDIRGIIATDATVAGVPVNVPAATPTVLLTLSVPYAGLWFFTGNTNTNAPLPGSVNALVQLDNGGSFIGEDCHMGMATASISVISHSVVSYLINCAGGEIITLSMLQDSPGALAVNAVINGIRLGV